MSKEMEVMRAEHAPDLAWLTPERPPRPPEGSGVPRYGLRWNGPKQPLSVPMDDGYWTPWHLASARIAELEDLLATAVEYMQATLEYQKMAYKGHESAGGISEIEADIAAINAALAKHGEAGK